MTVKPNGDGVFSLPKTPTKANQVFYAMVLSGLVFVPMLLLTYHRFLEPQLKVSLKEFFLAFTMIYLLVLVLCKRPTKKASETLRRHLGDKFAIEVSILAPAAANSLNQEIVTLGRNYWFWQLIGGYLTGVFFSWIGGIFFLFVL